MANANSQRAKPALRYFKFLGRILLIFFIGLSLYLFVSTLMMIILTKSAKDVKMPDVAGQQFTDVYNGLMRKGLKPELIFRDTFDVESGTVLKQYPEAGAIVPEGDAVKLTVSRSGYFIEMPDLVGKSLPVVKNNLNNLHYHGRNFSMGTGVISYIPSGKAENTVIAQSPKAGETVTPERKINLLISVGETRGNKNMPDIKGQSVDLAFDLLSAMQLNVVQETVETWEKGKSGTVLTQTPEAGKAIASNGTVRLKIALYPLHGHPYYAYEKLNYTIPASYSEGFFEALVEDEAAKRICFSGNMKASELMTFVYHRTGNAKISILRDKSVISVIGVNVENF